MKKYALLAVLAMLLCLALTAQAGDMSQDKEALKTAETVDQQLEILNRIAREHAEELENGWDTSLFVPSGAQRVPEGTIPDDWEAHGYTKASGFPAEMRERKCLMLSGDGALVATWFCRLPEQMRAKTLAEAEYAIVVDSVLTKSGYNYIPPATSYHRDYAAYILDLKTGEAVRFWAKRNSAKSSGKLSELNGDTMSNAEIWRHLRSEIWGEIRWETAEGAELIFGLTGKNCYLKGYAGEPANVEVPAAPEGHPVVEIGEKCFANCKTLTDVFLPDGIKTISANAFDGCGALESVRLPSTLEVIGDSAFYNCYRLQAADFPEGIRSIGALAYYNADALTEITLPASLSSVGKKAFKSCDRLSRAVMESAVSSRGESLFEDDGRLTCLYLPAGVSKAAGLENLRTYTAVYAPADSFALRWAAENGHRAEACEDPAEMPPVTYLAENDFEFLLFEGEAALSAYLGESAHVAVPETAGGLPVTRILHHAIYNLAHVTSVMLPASVREVIGSAIYGVDKNVPLDIYIANPEISIDKGAIGRYGYNETPVTVHAPEGSTAQRYVNDTAGEPLAFEPWGEGVNPDARTLKNAVALAGQVQQAVIDFWQTCDQTEYSWLRRIPAYGIEQPEAAAVLRLTRAQYDALTQLMTGPENTAKVFSVIVNTQWNLPYARAAVRTAQAMQFKPVPDGACAVAVLAYHSDLLLVTLDADGGGQAALLCSSPSVVQGMTPQYIAGIAAQYGVTGECAVYTAEEVSALLSK